ncbi:hypothetical protein QVD17_39004 [Tagetes erecta]|uniref:Uncharacterized protein n=1 Tax=Tagetes erecta TaxID=13708 RepID=A0AAD8NES7_TARER|nr:hypothetical protein QVD17_39004 [Tagetes erecta]
MSNSTSNTHILVFPLPPPGHLIPLLDLTHHLLRYGLTVTIVISTVNLPLLNPLLSSHPSSLHKLLLSDPAPSPSPHPLIAKLTATRQLFDPIVQWFESHPAPPVAIISDFFLGWTNDLATHLGIRRVVFSPSGALGYSIFHKLWRDVLDINALNDDGDENFMLSFPDIPSSPQLPWWQLSETWRSFKKGDPGFESFRKGILGNMTSWGIVFNTFEDLEGDYIDYMKKQMGHDRIWAVGPLLPTKNERDPKGSTGRGGSSVVPPDDLFMWLDQKRDESVVYICFGSRETLDEKEMKTLTVALALSNVDFVLCVHESGSNFIPSGFKDQVGGRGFIFKGWAPQLEILRHKAIGLFITHCGWNSTLEAITSGVTMLTWPMGADQFTNAALVVDQLGVGKRVCDDGSNSVPDSIKLA